LAQNNMSEVRKRNARQCILLQLPGMLDIKR